MKKKENKPKKTEIKLNESDYICFYNLVKEEAKKNGPIKFVIEDGRGNSHHIRLTEEAGYVEGKKTSDSGMRRYINSLSADFERLFLEATSKNYPSGEMTIRLTLAKLADMAAKLNQTITVKMYVGNNRDAIDIWREDNAMAFRVNGERVGTDEAVKFVSKNHGIFLINLKGGIKTARKRASGVRDYDYNKKPEKIENKGKTSIVDGKIVVDTDSFLKKDEEKPKGKVNYYKKKKIEKIKEAIILKGTAKRGYVEE